MEDFMKEAELISGMSPVEIKSNSKIASKGEGESSGKTNCQTCSHMEKMHMHACMRTYTRLCR